MPLLVTSLKILLYDNSPLSITLICLLSKIVIRELLALI